MLNCSVSLFLWQRSTRRCCQLIIVASPVTGISTNWSTNSPNKSRVIDFAYSWIAARNTIEPGFYNGIDLEWKEADSAIFPDSNLTQNFIITVTQTETFVRYLMHFHEKMLNILKDVTAQYLPGYAWVNTVFEKKVELFWIYSIFTKVFNPDGAPCALSNKNFIIM